MKNGPLFFIGIFVALLLSWGGLVLGSHAQLGDLKPYFDETQTAAFPERLSGVAARGQYVYADLGCAACHTQQVRRPEFGNDKERGWGDRQSVARDYIFQPRPQLGSSRLGPDLANLGGRKPTAPTADSLLQFLYLGSATHPSYTFLFEEREVAGQRSMHALNLSGTPGTAAGHEIVPSERARTLVTYLLSLNNTYDYPESRPVPAAAGGHGAPAEKHDAGKAEAKK